MNAARLEEVRTLVDQASRRLSPERAHALLAACRELSTALAASEARDCRTCDALARHARVPSVRVAQARLIDELSMAEMLATSPPRVRAALGRLADWRRSRALSIQPWRIVLESLANGPLPTSLIDEDLHGPPVADKSRMRHRQQATRNVVRRLILRHLVIRVGWSVYAIPGHTAGMVDRTVEDARKMLREQNPAHPTGYTTLEIADRCDVSPNTVSNWLAAMRQGGDVIVATHAERLGRHGSGFTRYRIELQAEHAPPETRASQGEAAG